MVIAIIVQLPMLVFLITRLYASVQARTLEFLLTLVISTMPVGLCLRAAQMQHSFFLSRVEIERAVAFGLFFAVFLFGGAVWGLSLAGRLGEQRSWRRLGLLALGWMVIPSMFCLVALPFQILLVVFGEFAPWWLLICCGGSAPFWVGWKLEKRCEKAKCASVFARRVSASGNRRR
ncbi:MAG TPA: hypothetical protein VGP72_03550 [Planctomycetota bacterium]